MDMTRYRCAGAANSVNSGYRYTMDVSVLCVNACKFCHPTVICLYVVFGSAKSFISCFI